MRLRRLARSKGSQGIEKETVMLYADSFCSYTEDKRGYIYKGPCRQCKKETRAIIPPPELYAYRQGTRLQHAMPSVSDGDREFLLTGNCSICWQKMLDEEEGDGNFE